VKVLNSFLIFISLCLSAYSQLPQTGKQTEINTAFSTSKNYPPNIWNDTIGSSAIDVKRSGTGESMMGNFVCDAMLNHTLADFAFITYGELYGELYKGEITNLDMYRLIPFDRTLVVLEMNGDTLKQIIERTLGSLYSGMAISGAKVEYDPDRPYHNRLTFVEIGVNPLYPKKIYRVVTIDYLANGNAGFDLLQEINKTQVFRTGTLLRDVLIEQIKQYSPLDQTKVSIDNRWIMK
jgi:2',3'-cyclic-nucleotide 2'-phosphodiesterase (5'-nucleotidase family)